MAALRIGLVVGEASGDLLAASLILAMKQRVPDLKIEGIAGPKSREAGCHILAPMDPLSVMGVIEPLKHLSEILTLRKQIKAHFLANPPDLFIGVDAPAFNLSLEVALHQAGIKVVHYVSPTIWAWKKNRIHNIKRAVDLMICLLPFEPPIYHAHQIQAIYVGHPLADEIPRHSDSKQARKSLGLREQGQVLAALPGSRAGELRHLSRHFFDAIYRCRQQIPTLQVLIPLVNDKRRRQLEHYLRRYMRKYFPNHACLAWQNALGIQLIDGQARTVLAAADVVLSASGTATLEAMLVKRPMVVAYRFNLFNALLARLLIRAKFIAWPNILAQKRLVPELIQYQVNGERLAAHLLPYFSANNAPLLNTFAQLHEQLRQGGSQEAATAILKLLD